MQIQVSTELIRPIQIQKAREIPRLSELDNLRLSCLNRICQVNAGWGYPAVKDVVGMQSAKANEHLTDVCLQNS